MIVRAYFLLGDRSTGAETLVPILRTVPESAAEAAAAMAALLAGPSARERTATPRITTFITRGTEVLSLDIVGRTATIDLSASFVDTDIRHVVRARLGQVVYTLTQSDPVDVVVFLVEGRPIHTYGGGWSDFDGPLTRVAFQEDLLPAIYVERPAWGAGYPSGSRITGLAMVFEGQFRIALLAEDGTVLAERRVRAACGDGCVSDFEVRLPYTVTTAQWGTLRVWDISEADGSTIHRRDYPVYLRP